MRSGARRRSSARIPVYGEAHGRQTSPSVASDGAGYFAVWVDDRLGTKAIFGARVRETGEVIDENGLLLVRNVHSLQAVRVVWTGTSYAVVWLDSTSLKALRVDRDGRVLGAPVLIRDRVSLFSMESGRASVVLAYVRRLAGSELEELRTLAMDADLNELSDVAVADPANYGDVTDRTMCCSRAAPGWISSSGARRIGRMRVESRPTGARSTAAASSWERASRRRRSRSTESSSSSRSAAVKGRTSDSSHLVTAC